MKLLRTKRCLAILAVLLLLSAILPSAACGPPEVTDYATLLENLEHAGITVEVARQDTESMTYAATYLSMFRQVLDGVQETRNIEPAYYERETRRLSEIEEATKDFTVTFTDIRADDRMIFVNEYGSEAEAQLDAEYAKLVDVDEFTVVVPTDTEEVTSILQGISLGTPHFYQKGRIIVLFLERQSDPAMAEGNTAMTELLESLLGPEFHTR